MNWSRSSSLVTEPLPGSPTRWWRHQGVRGDERHPAREEAQRSEAASPDPTAPEVLDAVQKYFRESGLLDHPRWGGKHPRSRYEITPYPRIVAVHRKTPLGGTIPPAPRRTRLLRTAGGTPTRPVRVTHRPARSSPAASFALSRRHPAHRPS